jgi:hypothetical protein
MDGRLEQVVYSYEIKSSSFACKMKVILFENLPLIRIYALHII